MREGMGLEGVTRLLRENRLLIPSPFLLPSIRSNRTNLALWLHLLVRLVNEWKEEPKEQRNLPPSPPPLAVIEKEEVLQLMVGVKVIKEDECWIPCQEIFLAFMTWDAIVLSGAHFLPLMLGQVSKEEEIRS